MINHPLTTWGILFIFLFYSECFETAGRYLTLGENSYIKHDYLNLEIEIKKVTESENSKTKWANSAIKNLEKDYLKRQKILNYGKRSRIIKISDKNGIKKFHYDGITDKNSENIDIAVLNQKVKHTKKFQETTLSSYSVGMNIPPLCNNKIRIGFYFKKMQAGNIPQEIGNSPNGILLQMSQDTAVFSYIYSNDESKNDKIRYASYRMSNLLSSYYKNRHRFDDFIKEAKVDKKNEVKELEKVFQNRQAIHAQLLAKFAAKNQNEKEETPEKTKKDLEIEKIKKDMMRKRIFKNMAGDFFILVLKYIKIWPAIIGIKEQIKFNWAFFSFSSKSLLNISKLKKFICDTSGYFLILK